MPVIDDYDQNDPDSGGLSATGSTPAQSAAIGSATSGPHTAPAPKAQQDAYVPWSSFQSANQDVANREAGKLENQVQGDVSKAQTDLSNAQSGYDSTISSNYGTGQPSSTSAGTKSTKTQQPSSTAPQTVATPDTSGAAPATTATTPKGRQPTQAQYTPPTPVISRQRPAPTSNATPGVQQGYIDANGNFQFGTAPKTTAPATPPAASSTPMGTSSTSNPWASLSGPPQRVGASTSPGAQAMLGYGRAQSLTPGAAAGNPAGSKDLESQMGAANWNSLLGETSKAGQEANALGSTAGVQGLLQQTPENTPTGPANSAFDAMLIGGAGQKGFQQLADKYGNGQLMNNVVGAEQDSQNRWNQLSGDMATRQAFDQAAQGAASGGAPTSAAGGSTAQPAGSFSVTSTNGANGQFDTSTIPPGFDPTSNPQYQQALQQFEQAWPLPPGTPKTPQDFISWVEQGHQNVWDMWTKNLGISGDQLDALLKNMPQWQWELFARGVVPTDINRSGGSGYFEGFSPVQVGASGAGTDPKYKTAMDAFQAVMTALVSAGGGGAGIAGGQTVGADIAAGQDQSGKGVNKAADENDRGR